jgi:hypothetical protein
VRFDPFDVTSQGHGYREASKGCAVSEIRWKKIIIAYLGSWMRHFVVSLSDIMSGWRRATAIRIRDACTGMIVIIQ